MNFVENYENLAKACYDASGTIKNFAEAVREAEKAANRPYCPKTYFKRKRKENGKYGSKRSNGKLEQRNFRAVLYHMKKRRTHSVSLRCGAVNTKMERKGRESKKYGA